MMTLAALLLALIAVGGFIAVQAFIALKSRRRMRALDSRIDELASQTFDAAVGQDQRADAIGRDIQRVEEAQRIDHLFTLAAVAERSGRLGSRSARRLEQALIDLHDDARIAAR